VNRRSVVIEMQQMKGQTQGPAKSLAELRANTQKMLAVEQELIKIDEGTLMLLYCLFLCFLAWLVVCFFIPLILQALTPSRARLLP
jgi:hypothetical protein